ncbi:MAG: DUF3006 domain-containing protein [Chloroflexi bacterium]|nr:DUF3006 domain-containing protein [Chloroflexota bacterium]
MIEKAVIDRFEEDQAVLLVGDQERKLVVPRTSLPHGVKEGHWLKIEVQGQKLVIALIDEEETARVKQRIAEKLERLRRGEQL